MRLALAPKVAVVEEDEMVAEEDEVGAEEDKRVAEEDKRVAEEDEVGAVVYSHRDTTDRQHLRATCVTLPLHTRPSDGR